MNLATVLALPLLASHLFMCGLVAERAATACQTLIGTAVSSLQASCLHTIGVDGQITETGSLLSYSHFCYMDKHFLQQEKDFFWSRIKQVISFILPHNQERGFHPVQFMAPKEIGDFRPILGLHNFNTCITHKRFCMLKIIYLVFQGWHKEWCLDPHFVQSLQRVCCSLFLPQRAWWQTHHQADILNVHVNTVSDK